MLALGRTKRLQRDRAASRPNFQNCDRIRDHVAYLMSDRYPNNKPVIVLKIIVSVRINDVAREFQFGLDLGCASGPIQDTIMQCSMVVMSFSIQGRLVSMLTKTQ